MKKAVLFLVLALALQSAYATHNRAGEISYRCMGGLSYEVTVTTYTKIGTNIVADRCEVTVYFGDGDSAILPRINGGNSNCNPQRDGVPISSDMKLNIYRTVSNHVYPGAGNYKLTMYDPNRNSNIVNIPNSVNTPFYIEAWLYINPLLGSCNNSAVLTYPPIDNACLYKCFIHNPAAYDPDGDSLSYSLGTPLGNGGSPVPGYSIPSGVSLNPVTGDLLWCTPLPANNPPYSYPQEYNFAIYVKEWRKFNGQWYAVGITERDLQVDVENCVNNPPDILTVNDTCVLAGNTLTFQVTAVDQDNDILTLSATGAPMLVIPSASFPSISGMQPVTGTFTWNTACNLVRQQPYQVLFKAVDNDPNNPLVDLESVFITIISPPPVDLQGTAQCTSLTLTWDTASCDPVNNKVKGYRIYMDDTCNPWMPGTCETGVPSYTGYSLIGIVNGKNNTSFVVNNLIQGVNYSFRVVTEFNDGAQSMASLPICLQLKMDVPIITNVDVTATSSTVGTIDVKWVKPSANPNPNGLDTTIFPGPYKYEIFSSAGFVNPASLIATLTSPTYTGLSNTSITDNNLNTDGTPYVYRIDFYSGSTLICQTTSASSVYLTLGSNDNVMNLSWDFNVPWTNTKYYIWKEIPTSSNNWVKIDSTSLTTYTDDSLINGATYCYYVESVGSYSDPNLPAPLFNKSERKCGIPLDLTAPCAPVIAVNSDCDLGQNFLTWTNPNLSCADDVVAYNIYFTSVQGQDMNLLVTLSPAGTINFMHDSLTSVAGCYAITAVDSFGNESPLSNLFCVDNCPLYELPNVFTPNGDGMNDLFIPFPYRFVKDVDIKIYNRWGEVVFQTTDPDVNWDGVHRLSKKLCSDGVYYYTCVVNEIRLSGIEPRVLKGFVHLFGEKN
jgi:gliding motility-associated-like protein